MRKTRHSVLARMSKGVFKVPVVLDEAAIQQAAAIKALQQSTSHGNLFLGIRAGNPEAFFNYARVQPNAASIKDDDSHIPLHWFALRGETEHCKAVISMGSQVCRP